MLVIKSRGVVILLSYQHGIDSVVSAEGTQLLETQQKLQQIRVYFPFLRVTLDYFLKCPFLDIQTQKNIKISLYSTQFINLETKNDTDYSAIPRKNCEASRCTLRDGGLKNAAQPSVCLMGYAASPLIAWNFGLYPRLPLSLGLIPRRERGRNVLVGSYSTLFLLVWLSDMWNPLRDSGSFVIS